MISEFQGEYRFLSNFGEGGVHLDGVFYPRREHAYQASKSNLVEVKHTIAALPTAGAAKRYGQSIDIRPDWEQVKKRVMMLVVMAAFIQNPDLQKLLAETGDQYLEEGNRWHDNFWGNCLCQRCTAIHGRNWLGTILMHTRDVVVPD